jgi:transposase
VPLEKLVFLDESGAKTNMVRLRGRCPSDERLRCKSPAGHWKITTMICAIRLGGPCAACVVDAPTDGEIFKAYVETCLVPCLQEGDVVVMDNLTPHKAATVRQVIESVGARVLYLPAYSPDFNPIENMWSKVKAILRSIAATSFGGLCDAIDTALGSITADDCRGFFGHCGYNAT